VAFALKVVGDLIRRRLASSAFKNAIIASIGGFVKQYAVVIDPGRMRSLGIPLSKVREVIRQSSLGVGGRTVELAEHEFMVRGRGYIKNVADLERIVVKSEGGTPVLLKDIARVELAPDERRGIAELNGEGEVASGIALQRVGANALTVINNVKARLAEIAPSLPEGVSVLPVYDRSELIYRAIETLRRTLLEEGIVVALVCVAFLLHVRSALVAILMLPVGVLMAFLAMKSGAGGSAAQNSSAIDPNDHLPAALPQLPAPHRSLHGHAVAAVRACGRSVATVVARLQSVGGRSRRFIALAGVAAETGVVMLIYLDHAVAEVRARCAAQGRQAAFELQHVAITCLLIWINAHGRMQAYS
jgi:Cu/Ag efflux pump CusA